MSAGIDPCVSLDRCRAEQHPTATCAECPARVCVGALEHGRCNVCIARRLRRARAEGRIDAFGQPMSPEQAAEVSGWGEVELVIGEPGAATRMRQERPGTARTGQRPARGSEDTERRQGAGKGRR